MERVKWMVLVGLWSMWIPMLAARVLTLPEPSRVPLKFISGQQLRKAAFTDEAVLPRLAVRNAFAGRRHPSPVRRNIFAPLPKPRKAYVRQPIRERRPPRPKAVPSSTLTHTTYVAPLLPPSPPAPTSEELAAQQTRQQRELTLQQARQLMAQYRYLGYLMQHGEPRAFLSKGQELYIVQAGEVLEGQIHVALIDGIRITLRDATGTVERSLNLNTD